MVREHSEKELSVKRYWHSVVLVTWGKRYKNQDCKGNLEQTEILHVILPYGILNIMLYKAIELSHAKMWRVWAYISESYHLSYKENSMFNNSSKDSN